MKTPEPFPQLKLDDWQKTKDTLHLFLQVVGKIRLSLHPKTNHWWHVPFYVSVNGLTTGPIPYDNGLFEMEFNFLRHALEIKSSRGDAVVIHLDQFSLAQFYDRVMEAFHQMDINVSIQAKPYDMPNILIEHFKDGHDYDTYDRSQVETMWQILISVNNVFQEFRGQFSGKSTPVHLFWHHFDLALTRFSGREAPARPDVSQVEREAYSHEVISFGFWFGDDNLKEPAFYAYGFPAVDSVYTETLKPSTAEWNEAGGMALLKYEAIRESENPKQMIYDFLESSYLIYAKEMNWDIDDLSLT